MISTKPGARVAGIAVATAALCTLAISCSSTAPTVDAGAQSGTVAPPGTEVTRGSGTAAPGTTAEAPGSTAVTDPGTSVAGESTTTVVGAPPVTGTNGAPATTAAPAGPGGVTTVAGVTTTAKPGTPTTAPVTTKPVTTAPTTAPPTTAPAKPKLSVKGPDTSTKVDDRDIHCMGAQASASTTVIWKATGATQVAVSSGNQPNAFNAPSKTVHDSVDDSKTVTFACSGGATQYTTVTARGPGGDETQMITWTMHHM